MIKRILATSSYSFLSRFLITAINLFFVWFISKNLGAENLGVYGIVFFFYQFFASVSSFNLYKFFGKEIAGVTDDREKKNLFFNELFSVTIIGLIIGLIILVITILFYHRLSITLILYVFPAGILLGIERNLSGILLGMEKMKFEFYSNLVSFGIIIVVISAKGHLFFSIKNILILKIVSQLFAVGVKLIPFKNSFSSIRPKLKLNFFHEGKFFWFTGLSNLFLRQADIFILSFFIGKSLLGSYFLAIRIYYFFGLFAEILSFAMTPFISRTFLGKEKHEFKKFNMTLIKIFSVFALIFSLLLYLGRDFIVRIFSSNPGNTSSYLSILSIFVFFTFLSYITGNILTSTKYQNIRFYISSSSSLLLIVLNLILAPIFSVNGAIIAKGTAEFIVFLAFGIYVLKIFKGYELKE